MTFRNEAPSPVSFTPDEITDKQIEAFTNRSPSGLFENIVNFILGPEGRRHFWSRKNRFK